MPIVRSGHYRTLLRVDDERARHWYMEEAARKTMPQPMVALAEHEQRMSLVLAAIPEQYREWVRRFLARSNEPSLRVRIEQVIARLGHPSVQTFLTLYPFSKDEIGFSTDAISAIVKRWRQFNPSWQILDYMGK